MGASASVHGKKAVASGKDLLCPGEPLLGEHGGEHGTAGRLPCLQALGEGTIDDALAVPCCLAVGNAKGMHHLHKAQLQQLPGRSRGPKDTNGRRAVPASVDCCGECQPTGNVEPQRYGQHQVTTRHPTTPLGHGKTGCQCGGAGMHTACPVKGIVKIQSVPHGRIDQCRLWCRDLVPVQQQAAFRAPPPAPYQPD